MFTKSVRVPGLALAGALCAALSISPLQAELSSQAIEDRLSAIAADAATVEEHAWKMEKALRTKNPDYDAVRTMLGDVSAKIESLGEAVRGLEKESPAWASSSDEYALMLEKTTLLEIFAKNKSERLESSTANKDRRILASKAKGIALRASMLQDTANSYGD